MRDDGECVVRPDVRHRGRLEDVLPQIIHERHLRRVLDRSLDIHKTKMHEVMTAKPKTAKPRMLAAEAVHLMDTHRITALPVVDDAELIVGALNIHDLFRAGVM